MYAGDWVWPSSGRCLQIANWFLSISHNQNYYGEHKISLGLLLLTSWVAASLLSRIESWFYNLISVRKLHERPAPWPGVPPTSQRPYPPRLARDTDVLAYAYKFVDYQYFFNEFGEAAAAAAPHTSCWIPLAGGTHVHTPLICNKVGPDYIFADGPRHARNSI